MASEDLKILAPGKLTSLTRVLLNVEKFQRFLSLFAFWHVFSICLICYPKGFVKYFSFAKTLKGCALTDAYRSSNTRTYIMCWYVTVVTSLLLTMAYRNVRKPSSHVHTARKRTAGIAEWFTKAKKHAEITSWRYHTERFASSLYSIHALNCQNMIA